MTAQPISLFNSLDALGWTVYHITDGHDVFALYDQFNKCLQEARENPSKPIAIVLKTIKGKGVKSTEESSSGGHGYPLKAYDERLPSFISEIYDGDAPDEFIDWANNILRSKPQAQESSPDLFGGE